MRPEITHGACDECQIDLKAPLTESSAVAGKKRLFPFPREVQGGRTNPHLESRPMSSPCPLCNWAYPTFCSRFKVHIRLDMFQYCFNLYTLLYTHVRAPHHLDVLCIHTPLAPHIGAISIPLIVFFCVSNLNPKHTIY